MRLYRALLHLYPASFRNEYSAEMCAVLAQRLQRASGTISKLAPLACSFGFLVSIWCLFL